MRRRRLEILQKILDIERVRLRAGFIVHPLGQKVAKELVWFIQQGVPDVRDRFAGSFSLATALQAFFRGAPGFAGSNALSAKNGLQRLRILGDFLLTTQFQTLEPPFQSVLDFFR